MKKVLLLIMAMLGGLPLFASHAGGPWLVYQWGSKTEGGYNLINLGYDNGPQFSSSEADADEDGNLRYKYNKDTKKTEIWLLTYDGDDDNAGSLKNDWHRTSWGREGKTFILLYSQYEVVGVTGVADHGVGFLTGSCVLWPNRGKDIGVPGEFPMTLTGQLRRLDGGWVGAALGSGDRQVKSSSGKMSLETNLTKALNDARAGLTTNLEAKNWLIDHLVSTRGFEQTPDEIRP